MSPLAFITVLFFTFNVLSSPDDEEELSTCTWVDQTNGKNDVFLTMATFVEEAGAD